MRLLITCKSSGTTSTLIQENASDADVQMLRSAMAADDAGSFLLNVPARLTPDGPVRDRLVYAGDIESVVVA